MEYKLKPGFDFWKALATMKYPVEKLRVWIPDSFVVLGNNTFYWLRTNEATGKLIRRGELHAQYLDFEKNVYAQSAN